MAEWWGRVLIYSNLTFISIELGKQTITIIEAYQK